MSMVEIASVLARAITDKSSRENKASQLLPGTVLNYQAAESFAGTYATVHMVGDPPDVTLQIPAIGTGILEAGDMVMVLFDPPQGAYVFSKIDPATEDCTLYEVVWAVSGAVGVQASPLFTTPMDYTLNDIVVAFGTPPSGGTHTLHVYKNGSSVWNDNVPLSTPVHIFSSVPDEISLADSTSWKIGCTSAGTSAADMSVSLRFV